MLSAVLAESWQRTADRRTWSAMTVHGGVLTASRSEVGGWRAAAEPPGGLWDVPTEKSGELPTRVIAQQWAERAAARLGW